MKVNLFLLITFFFFQKVFSQESFNGTLSIGYGANFYENTYPTDAGHFRFQKPFTSSLDFVLLKELNKNNSLLAHIGYSARRIQYKYEINEASIPLQQEMTAGQKYGIVSAGIGYRKTIVNFRNAIYFENRVNADFSKNVLGFNKGTSESLDIEEEVLYNAYGKQNIGEKTIVPSITFGAGIILGRNEKFDVGVSFNYPFKSLQQFPGIYQIEWLYKRNHYNHELQYLGRIYYLKFSVGYKIF